jgi:hypothetical protein
MRNRGTWIGIALAAVVAGALGATAIASPGAAGQTVTLGSVTGSPTMNLCVGSCTYLPFAGVASPSLQVPFDGTVTSFSLNAGSSGGSVRLRVLRPAGGGQFTAVANGPAATIPDLGVSTFAVSVPVKAGDLLALDNDSSAILFDTSDGAAVTAYYQPALADGATAAPNRTQGGLRLLFSATVQSPASTTTGPGTTPAAGAIAAPTLSRVRQSHRVWRETKKHKKRSGRPRPVGTSFSFTMSERARVSFTFQRHLRKGRLKTEGRLSFLGRQGNNELDFRGLVGRTKKLPVGRYTLLISAATTGGATSGVARLSFTIVH